MLLVKLNKVVEVCYPFRSDAVFATSETLCNIVISKFLLATVAFFLLTPARAM